MSEAKDADVVETEATVKKREVVKIEPVDGGYTLHYGRQLKLVDVDLEDVKPLYKRRTLQIAQVMDGLDQQNKALGEDGCYEKLEFMKYGMYTVPKKDVFCLAHGAALKIHVAIDWSDEKSVEAFRRIVEVCATPNDQGESTRFKVLRPVSPEEAEREEDPEQLKKSIVIYANYRPLDDDSGWENVTETKRIVQAVSEILEETGAACYDDINDERRCRRGVFIRPGVLSDSGRRDEDVKAPFGEQLNKLKDGVKAMVEEAIEQGLL